MDEVFKALADPTRRELLDRLFERDGQTLERPGRGAADVPLRRDEAPEGAGGGGAGDHAEARAREAALPQPRPDQAHPRPLGGQVRGALGLGAQRAEAGPRKARTRRTNDERGAGLHRGRRARDDDRVRDLHQDDAGAPLGGDHQRADARALQLRGRHRLRVDRGTRVQGRGPRRRSRSPAARTSRSTRRGGWSRASPRSGARTSSAKASQG